MPRARVPIPIEMNMNITVSPSGREKVSLTVDRYADIALVAGGVMPVTVGTLANIWKPDARPKAHGR